MAFSPEYLAENRGPIIIVSNAIITAIAALVVLLRVTSRFAILKKLGSDDWTIVVATILAIVNIVIASRSVSLGTGRHVQAVPKANIIPSGVYRFVTRVIYFLATGTIKISVCFLYLRIFPNIRKATLVLIAVTTSVTVADVMVTIFQCVPVPSIWDTAAYPHAVCINNIAFSYSAAALSVVTDIWALILPIPTVWGLQIATRKKLTLIGLFSLGMFACIAGIIRMAFLITLLASKDATWDTYGTSIASGWEIALAIITASIPGLKPVFDKVFPKIFLTSRGGSLGTRRTTGYEMGGSRNTSQGFKSLGTSNKGEDRDAYGDGDSTTAIKVNYEYHVRSDPER